MDILYMTTAAAELLNLFDDFERELRGGIQFTQGGSTKERSTEPYSKYEWWMDELTKYVKGVVDDKESKRREYEKYNKGMNGKRDQFLADKVRTGISQTSQTTQTSLTSSDISMFESKSDSSKKLKNAWLK